MILRLILQVATLGAVNYGVDKPIAAPEGKRTTAEEFDRIDPTVWRHDTLP